MRETPKKRRRSVAEMLGAIPTPEGQAVYAMERIASIEDQIAQILDLCGAEAREIVFKRRAAPRTLKQTWGRGQKKSQPPRDSGHGGT